MEYNGQKKSSKWTKAEKLGRLSKQEQRDEKKIIASKSLKSRRAEQKRTKHEPRYHPTSLLAPEEVDPSFDYEFEGIEWGKPANWVDYDYTDNDL